DGDGKYNDLLRVADDYNHATEEDARRWIDACDSLSDKICQPTLHPLKSNVIPFLFYAYNPSWERPIRSENKEFEMIYVGHSKCRWCPMSRVLRGIEPVRSRLGRIGLVGYGWDTPPHWATSMRLEEAYFADTAQLERLAVEPLPPVRFECVIEWMSK